MSGTDQRWDDEREQLLGALERDAGEVLALSRWMSAHPELSLAERATSDRYVAYLAARGFAIERGIAGLETAFVARRGSGSLHAALLAASALAGALPPDAVSLVVVGCPAEELGIGKRRLVAAGVFDGVDAALMAHASDMRRAHRLFLGNRKFELVFHGRAAHAAAYPERGVNALDGVIALFVAIGLLRQQLPRGAKIHGIVSDGGQAPNVIPERAAARIWVRALEDAVLEDAAARLLRCAEGAATATGTRLEVIPDESASPPLRPNLALAAVYRRQLERLGLPESAHAPDESIGSSDITHVSRVVPTIHPNFPIGSRLALHTREFAAAAAGPGGEAGLLEGARALALSIHALAREPETRAAVAAEGP